MREVPFFKSLDDQELDRMAACEDYFLYFKKGDYIIRQGESETPIYILIKGKAIVTRNQNPNSELAKMKYGAVFGTVSFTESPLRETNVIAQNDAVVFKIEKGLIESFNEETHKKFCRLRKDVLLERLERLTMIVADLKAEIALLAVEEGEENAEFNWDF